MKHVTSYIFLIIAFLLLGVNGAAAQKEECPFTVTDKIDANISYDKENKVLSIEGSGNVTIEGDGTSTGWGIEIEPQSIHFQVTIKNLSIERKGVPLKIKGESNCSITIEGTNRFVSTGSSGTAGIEVKGSLSLRGSGSLTAIGAEGTDGTPGGAGIGGGAYLNIYGGIIHAKGGAGAAGISSGNTSIAGNAFVIAIDGEDADDVIATTTQIENHTKGLFIRGEQESDGSIVWASSALVGNVALERDAEIPDWAEVTIADGQSLTVPDGITLTNNGTITNNGTLTLEANGSIINNGTLSFGKYGKLNGSLGQINNNGGGEMVCDVEVVIVDIIGQPWTNIQGLNLYNTQKGKYDLNKAGSERYNLSSLPVISDGYELRIGNYPVGKKITIPFENRVTVKTIRLYFKIEDAKSVEVFRVPIRLTLEDLNIKADKALVYGDGSPGINIEYGLTLQGTNRLTSTSGPGMNLYNNNLTFIGSGSLTVTGGNGYAGIEASPFWLYKNSNLFVVAIGGKGAKSGISGYFNHHRGLLIHGTQDDAGSISQEYSALVGSDFTLGGDAEIPAWATVTIAEDQTFTIDAGVTLTNNGTIENNGIIRNKGTLKGKPVEGTGKLYNVITFNANYSASPVLVEKDFLQGDALPSDIFTRSGYTFQGWYDDPDGGTKVETVTEPQTLYARWKAVPVPEPEPEPAPTIYYTVTLPFVEGAATDPVAGDYDVESWSTFRFYLTLDTAYSQSQPIVTTDRGETLVPRTSDGAYLVKYVRTDVEVYIDGIEKNNPVANEPIRTAAPEPEIWSEDACLCIRLPEGLPTSPVRIFTAEGRLLDSFRSTPGLNRRQLPMGIYIVQVGATVRKVAIR